MSTNGVYEGQFEKLVEVADRIDRKTTANGEALGSLAGHLRKISDNTSVIAHHYGEAREDNRELSKLAAGKQQVPLSLVLVALVFGGVWILIDKIERGDIEVRIPFLGIDITHHRAE